MTTPPIIACTLEGADQRARLQRYAAMDLRAREPIARGERLTFALSEAAALRDAVAAEAECCAFLTFDLRQAPDGALILDITGPEGTEPAIAALFAS